MAEELATVPPEPRADQEVIRPWSRPMYPQGHLAILRGNLAPEGCVAKITGLKTTSITGPARVFDSEPACLDAIMAKKIRAGDVIVVDIGLEPRETEHALVTRDFSLEYVAAYSSSTLPTNYTVAALWFMV